MGQRTGGDSDGRGTQEAQARATPGKIAASPDPFNGHGDWQERRDAFEVCSDLNGWSDKEKL
ncbi:hypothetical protein M514_11390 [Trichuris suis]|uniref:Uncharacterized protein n=1 Tax=Trichuris suis TaxID=68888 RepID=A0A085LRW6_9BILA|nr:hypothetical protein M513_11390 [Trichuris suis]KFD60858.1 hypothetical protein M514_11390 [Trichuris suis]